MRRKSIIKNLCLWMIGIGFLLLVGTAGSSDMEMISLSALSSQNLAASVLLILGAIGNSCVSQTAGRQYNRRISRSAIPGKAQRKTNEERVSRSLEMRKGYRMKKKASSIAV